MSFKLEETAVWNFFFILTLMSCNISDNAKSLPSIKIDLKEEVKTISFSDLLKSNVDIIPFQSFDSNQNPIYFNNINRLDFVNDEFYVLDYIQGQFLMVFSLDGEFKRSIGFRGEGPGGYLQPMDFKILQNEILVLDVGKLLVYDLEGNYLSQKETGSMGANAFEKIPGGYAFIGGGMGTDNLILSDEELELQNSFFPYHTRALNVLIVNPLFNNQEGKIIYRRNLNDTLFQIDDFERPNPYLYIDFQQYKSNYVDLLKSQNVEESIKESLSEVCNVYAYYETKDYKYLVFSLHSERWNFIYSNVTGKSILFRQSNLIDEITFDPNMMPVGVVENKFILKANPENVLAGLKNFQGSSKTYQKLKELKENLDPEGNPTLFLVEFDF